MRRATRSSLRNVDRATAFAVVVVLLLTLVHLANAPSVLAGPGPQGLDVRDDRRDILRGEVTRLYATFEGDPGSKIRIAFEWVSGPGDHDGATFETPDRRCRLDPKGKCRVDYITYSTGMDEIHAWVIGRTRDKDENVDEVDNDSTDVVTRTWLDECRYFQPTITGTDNDDTLEGTSGRDVIAGARGNDVIRGSCRQRRSLRWER